MQRVEASDVSTNEIVKTGYTNELELNNIPRYTKEPDTQDQKPTLR